MAEPDAELAGAATRALLPIEAVRVAYLFGSRARGTARPDSDLDIAVIYADDAGPEQREILRRQVVAALTDALGSVGERADVVDLERAPSEIAFAAICATRLLARTDAERVRHEVRIARRYDDEAPRRALFRAAAKRVAEEMGRADGRS